MTRKRVVETWEGVSPSRGVVRVNLTVTDPTPIYEGTEWVESAGGLMVQQPRRVGWQGGGAGYDGTCEDGKAFEAKTIGLGSIERARDFAISDGHACKDVPKWTQVFGLAPGETRTIEGHRVKRRNVDGTTTPIPVLVVETYGGPRESAEFTIANELRPAWKA